MPPRVRRRRGLLAPAVTAVALGVTTLAGAAGCGGSSAPATAPTPRTPPDLAAFLRLPVATPSACPSTVSGSTSGRRSPWVGHVDVSVFLAPSVGPAGARRVGHELEDLPPVRHLYFESKRQAYAEFQRLYTCSEEVPARSVPASYRLVLSTATQPERDDLVRTIRRLDGVSSVSCDPSNPCVAGVPPSATK